MSRVATQDDILRLDNKIDVVDNKLETKIDTMSKEIRSEMRESFDDLTALLRTFMDQVDERLVLGRQIERLDKWTHDIAKEIGYKLST